MESFLGPRRPGVPECAPVHTECLDSPGRAPPGGTGRTRAQPPRFEHGSTLSSAVAVNGNRNKTKYSCSNFTFHTKYNANLITVTYTTGLKLNRLHTLTFSCFSEQSKRQ